MSDDLQELKERISTLSNEQLIAMITVQAADYREEALDYARAELRHRRVNLSEAAAEETDTAESAVPAANLEPETAETRGEAPGSACLICLGQLRAGTLVAEKELTIFFNDNREERFVKVMACVRCGHVSLVVDYETEVQ
jgi:hypothetical protein